MESCSGIWKIAPEKDRTHPAPFPSKLAERCIKLLSYEKDIIYDPFLGSGSTICASEKLNRKWIGSELSESYCELAEQKLSLIPKKFM